MEISKFFDDEYSSYSMYDCYRSIANYLDGFKPTARKLAWTVNDRFNIQRMKVSSLANKMADEAEYLHGAQSAEWVTCSMAQDFPGTNNLNLLVPDGSFGNRSIQEPAASRYIYTYKQQYFDKIFIKEDYDLLPSQEFEGKDIEPKHYVPIIPMILVNGSEGIGNGFAQKILPRNPIELIDELIDSLGHQTRIASNDVLKPWYRGFKGKIEWNEESKNWWIYGDWEKSGKASIKITELPIGYDLQKYISVLDSLEEKKVIQGYEDKSDGKNKFEFEVRVSMELLKQDPQIIFERLKLIKRVSENFTCIDENNKIIEFKDVNDLLSEYYRKRLEFYDLRKKMIIEKFEKDLKILTNRGKFISGIISGSIKVMNVKKVDLESELSSKGFEQVDDSFNYLINMQISSLTKEKLEDLKTSITELKEKIEKIKKTSIQDLWKSDLSILKKEIQKGFEK